MWATRMPEMAGGADRGAGTASEVRLMCLPAVVTPHLRCVFHECNGTFLFLLKVLRCVSQFRLSHKILQKLQRSGNELYQQQQL